MKSLLSPTETDLMKQIASKHILRILWKLTRNFSDPLSSIEFIYSGHVMIGEALSCSVNENS